MPTTESRWADSQLIGTRVRSVWQWQLIFTFSVVVITVAVGVLDVGLLATPGFLFGILVIVIASIATLVTPWARTPKHAAFVLPVVDIVAIGFLSLSQPSLGYLWVFPIAWVATYYGTLEIVSSLAAVALMNLADPAHWDFSPGVIVELLIVLLALAFLAITISVGAQRIRAFRALASNQARRLATTVERVQSAEQRVNTVFDSISVALARIAPGGEIVSANSAYRALYSLDTQDLRFPVGGAVEYSAFRGRALAPSETAAARAGRGELVDQERLWLFDRSGTWRALNLSIRSSGANSIGEETFVVELEDLTVVSDAQREAPQATRTIAHELRNPLTAILGHADLLIEGDSLTPSQRDHVAIIESASERMLTLIQGILTQSTDADDLRARFDTAQLVAASIEAFEPAASAASLTIDAVIAGPLEVDGDEFRLRQVVDNIISNAIKYSDRGTLRIAAAVDDDGWVAVTIADEGIGMSSDDVERVFTPYFRAQTVQEGGVPGTGLGMGIARDIVESHGGSITVESALGRGTTVTVRLPAAGRGEGDAQ
ncbi:HAMP domain-containing histidine kinase [Microbacterium oleivorans]|uniref:sensor histidine kinase n=1 Tax=Microbacterium oleivorans TaxID=273677 RepID=UPI0010A3C9D1|nr:HAMP domain-containing sensor histidine kinase [Microbacterium oleivorans]THE08423.1 HAMP domain-containing histidine kinase [Microbacterium oleivorans]